MQIAGTAIMALGTMWQIAGPLIQAGGDEAAAGETAAIWPIALIVLGVAALIVAVYELWKHWNTVWGWIKDSGPRPYGIGYKVTGRCCWESCSVLSESPSG